MHGSVISVPTNVGQTQSILSRLPHDGVTIGVFFKRHLEYKLPCRLENVRLNMVMVGECTLRWLIFCLFLDFLQNLLYSSATNTL